VHSVEQLVVLLVICLPTLWLVARQALASYARLRYPADVEWIESPTLYQAYRLIHGLPALYRPDIDYLPADHPPGYAILLSLVGRVVGLSYAVGRGVSLAEFLLALGLVWRAFARQVSPSRTAVGAFALSVGIILAGAKLDGGTYDIARDDMTAMLLTLVAATLVDVDDPTLSGWRITAIAAAVAATVYTRVPAVFLVLWVVLYAAARDPKRAALLILACISACAACLVALQFASRGGFWIWNVTYHMLSPELDRLQRGVRLLQRFAPFLWGILPIAGWLAFKRRLSRRTVLWVGLLAAAFPTGLLPFSRIGGFWNDLTPIAFLTGPAALFVVLDLAAWFRAPRGEVFLWTAFVTFASFLAVEGCQPWRTYDGLALAPSEGGVQHAVALKSLLGSLVGGVLVPREPFLAPNAGDHTEQMSEMAYLFSEWANSPARDPRPYIDRINAEWALVDGWELDELALPIAERYEFVQELHDAPGTISGQQVWPRFLLRRERTNPGAHVVFDFERPLVGWTSTGDAFAKNPKSPRARGEPEMRLAVGDGIVSSFAPPRGDWAVGELVSPAFLIDRDHVALRVGGGTRDTTRVELRIDGQPVRKASAIFADREIMTRVVWDVSPYLGKQGRIAIVDKDRVQGGHVACDEVVLF
jgi:hypothetical protein